MCGLTDYLFLFFLFFTLLFQVPLASSGLLLTFRI